MLRVRADKQRPELDLSGLRPNIDKLAGHGDAAIQKAARDLQKALDSKQTAH